MSGINPETRTLISLECCLNWDNHPQYCPDPSQGALTSNITDWEALNKEGQNEFTLTVKRSDVNPDDFLSTGSIRFTFPDAPLKSKTPRPRSDEYQTTVTFYGERHVHVKIDAKEEVCLRCDKLFSRMFLTVEKSSLGARAEIHENDRRHLDDKAIYSANFTPATSGCGSV